MLCARASREEKLRTVTCPGDVARSFLQPESPVPRAPSARAGQAGGWAFAGRSSFNSRAPRADTHTTSERRRLGEVTPLLPQVASVPPRSRSQSPPYPSGGGRVCVCWGEQEEGTQMRRGPFTVLRTPKLQERIPPKEPAPFLDHSLVAPTYHTVHFSGDNSG